MGHLKMLNRAMKNTARQSRLGAAQRELERFYMTHVLSPWQKARAERIRRAYEAADEQLEREFDGRRAELSAKFMEHELMDLKTTDRWKTDHPGEPFPADHALGQAMQAVEKAGGFFKKFFGKKEEPEAVSFKTTTDLEKHG